MPPVRRTWPKPSGSSPTRYADTRWMRWIPEHSSSHHRGPGEGPYVQLWPHRHGTDAMFAAALRRRA
ncbi:putative fmu [Mycobacterium ulcerans str. Harvey]|uniref:Fmu n=1 Tax=Mycobacterium ulcerans str. Harvey TaxID=1299332 RepID=A0ABN0R0Y6_MYCUL|nr:putative fmu [Mycobacterium ulcerans str. Harvey]